MERGDTMDRVFEGPPREFAEREHPIELELTRKRVFGLFPRSRSLIITRAARIDFVCNLTLSAAVVIGTAAIVWHTANRPLPAAAVPRPALVAFPPVTLAEPEERPPVQVRNPFDATEVFEFPAGTSKTAAREATAELLLKRARDRRG
jgi:hypothetical protein